MMSDTYGKCHFSQRILTRKYKLHCHIQHSGQCTYPLEDIAFLGDLSVLND